MSIPVLDLVIVLPLLSLLAAERASLLNMHIHSASLPPLSKILQRLYCYKLMGQSGERCQLYSLGSDLMTLARWLTFSVLGFCSPTYGTALLQRLNELNKNCLKKCLVKSKDSINVTYFIIVITIIIYYYYSYYLNKAQNP